MAKIRAIWLRLPELQESDPEAKMLRSKDLPEGWEVMESVLQYQSFLYIPEIINSKEISHYYDNPLTGHFEIKKTRTLMARKYFWPIFYWDVEADVKGFNICLVSKAVHYKPYKDLQSLLILIHCWKDFFINFVIGFPLLVNWKDNSYDAILVIVV